MNRLLSLFLLSVFSLSAFAETLHGRVVSVADGDTVTVLDASNKQWKIRLAGIDAPEKKQPFGMKSKQNLSDLVFNKTVQVEYTKRDKYGRTIGKIVLDGADVNVEQIKAGLAWHYKAYQREQTPADRAFYAEAEITARAGKVGLWSEGEAMAPWDFRHGKVK
jgi:endonuclease YncB( thermonuclease family)